MPSMRASSRFRGILVLACALAVGACAGIWGASQDRRTTSVVEYLYPDQKEPLAEQGIPVLSLPMRVGVAFVPEAPGRGAGGGLSEARKSALLEQVAAHFRAREFIKSLEVIPSAYLTPRGGFANLDQLRTMHGIEAIALVSYDQTQFTEEGLASLMYWTIVGAYVVSGEKNDTQTMVDAVVMHIPSRKLLFRAPGLSRVKGRATLVNLAEELRQDSEAGFDQAVTAMVANLDQELDRFRQRVKDSPGEYRVSNAPGYTGGAATALPWAALLALLALGGAWWRRTR